MFGVGTDRDGSVNVHHIDLGNAVLLCQLHKRLLRHILRQRLCDLFGQAHQIAVRNITNVIAHIFHVGPKGIVHRGVSDPALEGLGKNDRNTKGQHHAHQQPPLEGLCNVLFALAALLVLSAASGQNGDSNDGQHDRKTVCRDHGYGTDLHNGKCSLDIFRIRQEHQQHMQNFCRHTHSQAIEPGRFFVVHHKLSDTCAKNTGYDGTDRAGQSGVVTGVGKPTFYTAHKARNQTGRPPENQACRQGCCVSDIQNRTIYRNAKLRCQNGHNAETEADNDLFPDVGKPSEPTFLLGLIKSNRHKHRQKRCCDEAK